MLRRQILVQQDHLRLSRSLFDHCIHYCLLLLKAVLGLYMQCWAMLPYSMSLIHGHVRALELVPEVD
jgi:hypothetical protein